MPTNPTVSMDVRYRAAQTALAAIRGESGIAARLRRVGIDAEKVSEGEAILAGVTHTIEEADGVLAQKMSATESVRRARRQLDTALRDLVQLARVSLGESHPWLEQAGIPPRRKLGEGAQPKEQSLDALVARAKRFFEAARSAEPETAALLQRIGLGPAAIQMAEAYIGNLQRAQANRDAINEVLSQKVTVRAAAFETLDDWMKELVAVARVALRDRPELLAAMGIAPRGRPRKS